MLHMHVDARTIPRETTTTLSAKMGLRRSSREERRKRVARRGTNIPRKMAAMLSRLSDGPRTAV